MHKKIIAIVALVLLTGCDKHDPVLPGVRKPIFTNTELKIENKTIFDLPEMAFTHDNTKCPYTQDSQNVIWNGNRKIFSGFATNNSVASTQKPICDGRYLYAGLTTGEVIKINQTNRQIMWIADVYSPSNMTGGASIVDIVAPIVPYNRAVYAGGMGDAFCKINATSGVKQWCKNISTATPFIIAGDYAFVVSADNYLYAIGTKKGDIFWRTEIEKQSVPTYKSGIITVGKMQINASDGKIIK